MCVRYFCCSSASYIAPFPLIYLEFFFPAFSLQMLQQNKILEMFPFLGKKRGLSRAHESYSMWVHVAIGCLWVIPLGENGSGLVARGAESMSFMEILYGSGAVCFPVRLCLLLLLFIYSSSFWRAGLARSSLQPTYLCACVCLGSF